jgi:hypothetical protein
MTFSDTYNIDTSCGDSYSIMEFHHLIKKMIRFLRNVDNEQTDQTACLLKERFLNPKNEIISVNKRQFIQYIGSFLTDGCGTISLWVIFTAIRKLAMQPISQMDIPLPSWLYDQFRWFLYSYDNAIKAEIRKTAVRLSKKIRRESLVIHFFLVNEYKRLMKVADMYKDMTLLAPHLRDDDLPSLPPVFLELTSGVKKRKRGI